MSRYVADLLNLVPIIDAVRCAVITSTRPAPAALITSVPARRHGRRMARDCEQHYLLIPLYIRLSQLVVQSFQTLRYDEHS